MNLIKVGKELFKQKIGRYGYLSKKSLDPIDFTGIDIAPIEAFKRANGFKFVVDVPLEKLRGLGPAGFSCDVNSFNPFVLTTKEIKNNFNQDYKNSSLYRFYQLVQPKNLSEFYGINVKDTHILKKLSPLCYIMPWIGVPSPEIEAKRKEDLKNENLYHNSSIKDIYGWQLVGPVTEEKAKLEHDRLKQLTHKIQKHGYLRSNEPDGDILGIILLNSENDYVITIGPGQHRAAVAGGLGFPKIPVRIGSKRVTVVKRDEVNEWPAVKAGVFSRDLALNLFDRIFSGAQPYGSLINGAVKVKTNHEIKKSL